MQVSPKLEHYRANEVDIRNQRPRLRTNKFYTCNNCSAHGFFKVFVGANGAKRARTI